MDLTDAQREIVRTEGDFLLLACPGSGKTRAAAARVMRVAGEPGTKVAACSYTNVGAERIASMLEQPLQPKHFVGTVHTLLLRYVVYPFAHLAGAKRGPELRHEEWPAQKVYGDRKQRVPLDEFQYDTEGHLVLRRPQRAVKGTSEEIVASVESAVKARKKGFFREAGMVSLDDAMWVALTLLRKYPEIAAAFARRFDEILVDEAQDTSELQLACIGELRKTGSLRSLVLIGDLEQSIYSFQGASAEGCRALAAERGLRELTLSENHRCSQKICDAARHFCTRAMADSAVGETRDCEIDPEVALYPHDDPEQAMALFRERLEAHQIPTAHAAVLARRRTMVESLAGTGVKVDVEQRPARIARLAVALAEGTLTRSDMRYAERTVARCAYGDAIGPEDLDDDARVALRAAAYRFISALPSLDGDLRTWISGAKEALMAGAALVADTPATAAGMLLKSKATHQTVTVAEVFTPPPRDLVPQTVHSIKGEDREAIMMVVRKPHGSDPTHQFELFDAIATGTEVSEEAEEERRVTFVALTRARRYCLVALPDTKRGRAIAEASLALGFLRV
ncbi:MAG TPA: UvrD-helicase domain-containing protein [Solirubrobacteraceae bacterium]|nr:UvrD-helicase domain-containing protein [Solirubrobacteraceae bacterium]